MKKQKLIVAAVLICGIILCIWGANILHNSSKQEETVSSEESSTASTTAYQTETTTQADTGGGEFDTYEYTDGELNKIETLVFHNGKHDEEGYIYNGEKISMEEGDNYIENLREHYQSLRGKR